MAKGEHVHDWEYNEARRVLWNNLFKWFVIRFCKTCKVVEDVELKEDNY